jgi:hypothetical protein
MLCTLMNISRRQTIACAPRPALPRSASGDRAQLLSLACYSTMSKMFAFLSMLVFLLVQEVRF